MSANETRRPTPGQTMTRAADASATLVATIDAAIREAQSAQPLILREPNDPNADYQVRRNPTPAAAVRFIDLAAAQPVAAPTAPDLLGMIRGESAFAGLGMGLIVLPERADAQTAQVALQGQPVVPAAGRGEHSVIGPLDFTLTHEDDVAPLAAWPATVTDIRHSGLRQHSVRVAVRRETLRHRPAAVLASEIATALIAGVGRRIDRLAFESLTTGDDQTTVGTWRQLVTLGTPFENIGALAGTDAINGSLAIIEGRLFLDGIPAVLTVQSNRSLFGDFRTHAVAIGAQLGLLVKKTTATGDLEVTAWFDAIGLSPTPATRLRWLA
ncbi:MAG: hypothetical protein O9248_00085 [Rhodobacteraceae bacterium]|nr:hypothetical protein [Paracoccaceae bacterium]